MKAKGTTNGSRLSASTIKQSRTSAKRQYVQLELFSEAQTTISKNSSAYYWEH